jgi:rubrerythrin
MAKPYREVIMRTVFLGMILLLTHMLPAFAETAHVEQIVNNEQGVYLLIDNAWLKTDAFQVSGEDAFALIGEEWMTLQEAVECGHFEVQWKCKKCGALNMEKINTCPYCGKKR